MLLRDRSVTIVKFRSDNCHYEIYVIMIGRRATTAIYMLLYYHNRYDNSYRDEGIGDK